MLNRPSDTKIVVLSILTLGTYFFYWCLRSAHAVNASAGIRKTPSNAYLFVPGFSYWWMWHYTQALESTSYGRIKGVDIFLVSIITGSLWTVVTIVPDDAPLSIIIATGITFLVSAIAGSAIFCIVAQHKINVALDAGIQR